MKLLIFILFISVNYLFAPSGPVPASKEQSILLRSCYEPFSPELLSESLQVFTSFPEIAFAQSKADKVYYSLSSEHLAECKTMHRKYTALVGITAITAKDEKDMDGSKAKYENKQYFDVAKSRKGEPARIAVDRLFQFQKFQERGKIGGGVHVPVHP
jgi:hypothetical protein